MADHEVILGQNQNEGLRENQQLVLGQGDEHHHLDLGQSQDHDELGLSHHRDHELGLEQTNDHDEADSVHRYGLENELGGIDRKPEPVGHELALPVQGHELVVSENNNESPVSDDDQELVAHLELAVQEGDEEIGMEEHSDDLSMDQSLVLHTPVIQARTVLAGPGYELKVGQEFLDVISCRRALRDTAIALHFEIQTIKSDKSRFTAKCATDGCPWRIHAAKLPGVPTSPS
ncbi:unnamed protein product [Linum tenue]|uniref:Transposase MuDR plant domain-containing protein n=1 Tax=Linum tenue TaxID=586396 RepID=A0AAV0MR92_9ROSI|nr:unnamed protein product [Linum tenue]